MTKPWVSLAALALLTAPVLAQGRPLRLFFSSVGLSNPGSTNGSALPPTDVLPGSGIGINPTINGVAPGHPVRLWVWAQLLGPGGAAPDAPNNGIYNHVSFSLNVSGGGLVTGFQFWNYRNGSYGNNVGRWRQFSQAGPNPVAYFGNTDGFGAGVNNTNAADVNDLQYLRTVGTVRQDVTLLGYVDVALTSSSATELRFAVGDTGITQNGQPPQRIYMGFGDENAAPLGDAVGASTPVADAVIQVPTPNGDSCEDAPPILDGTHVGYTHGASPDGSDPCGGGTEPDVWFAYTPAQNGVLFLNTCASQPSTIVSLHAACPPQAPLFCAGDCGAGICTGAACLNYPVSAGVEYRIRVTSAAGVGPVSYTLNVGLVATPPNDLCQNAVAVAEGSTEFSTIAATGSGPAVLCPGPVASPIANDIWFRYVPFCTGNARISLCGSEFNTRLAVYAADCPTGTTALACNNDFCGLQSEVALPVQAGSEYLVRIGGQWGNGTLLIECAAPGDMNCDGAANFFDIDGFILALFNPTQYGTRYPGCDILRGDLTGDGLVDFFDIDPFVACLFGTCP